MSNGADGWVSVYLKGVCMGAADTVPGVSGGTIAVVLGIYERLIAAVTALDPRTARHLLAVHTSDGRAALAAELRAADLPFLLALGAGVLSAAATVATAMNVAVTRYPAPTYAFFFGLIAASAAVLYRYVDFGTTRRVVAAAAGVAAAFLVTDPSLSVTRTTTLPVLFFAGALAISAMVLPGVSGAFLLLVVGQYEYVSGIPRRIVGGIVAALGGDTGPLTEALAPFVVFAAGAFVGLFSVAYGVRAALRRYREATLAFLVSLMVGSLRLPAREVATGVGDGPGAAAVVAGTALAGAVAVVALDRYTDDLQY